MSVNKKKIWLVGAGAMAQGYANVLDDMKADFSVIGRGENSAQKFEAATNVSVLRGGLIKALTDKAIHVDDDVIVALPVTELAKATRDLLTYGVKRVLVEKPAGIDPNEVTELASYAQVKQASVFVAYNRRFYASTQAAKRIIEEDGGVTSLKVEFSEFSHRVAETSNADIVKQNWLYANSTHVLDLAFYLSSFPKVLKALSWGGLDWHPRGSVFVGHGQLENDAPFSYYADWNSAPRWSVDIGTQARTLTFQPLEKLKYRKRDGFAEYQVELDDVKDTTFKPGLWQQTRAFIESHNDIDRRLVDLRDHSKHMKNVYATINNGGDWGQL